MKTIPYSIERSKKRRKSVAILVTPLHGVVVRAPHRTSDRYIQDLVENSRDWIQKKLESLHRQNAQPAKLWQTGEGLQYLGEPYTLEVWPIPSKKGHCELLDQTLFVKCPDPNEATQIKKLVEAWYRKQAKEILSLRTVHFAQQMGVTPAEIIVKQQKNRWGSCDRHNIIRYNWKVIMTSLDAIDYLVVHELAHINEKNHGKAFWALVEGILPDYVERRKMLKNFHPQFD